MMNNTSQFRPIMAAFLTLAIVCTTAGSRADRHHHDDHPEELASLYDTAHAHGSLGMFIDLATAAGFENTIRYRGPLTLLIPTDDALGEIAPEEMDRLLDDQAALQEYLKRYIVRGTVDLRTLVDSKTITTVSGHLLRKRR
jgi:uncharacterized surface protein with fasciclin (FAS1) repeats